MAGARLLHCGFCHILRFPMRSPGLTIYLSDVIRLTSDRTSTRLSDFRSRGILNIFQVRHPQIVEKSKVNTGGDYTKIKPDIKLRSGNSLLTA